MKKIILALFVFLSSLTFAATPQVGGTLVFGKSGDATTLDPSHVSDGESFHIATAIYDTLVQFKYGTTELEPALATSWDIADNGLEYVFHLRKGVYFSKTKYFKKKSEFTSADVVFSFKRQFDKKHAFNKIGGAYIYWSAMDMSKIVKDVIAVDKYTVKFLLKRQESPFLANLGMEFASILSNDYAMSLLKKGKTRNLGKKPVGTGPFVFKKWVKDDKFIFLANKNYWDGRPYLNKLIFKVITNNAVRAAELKAGSIHVMDFPNPAEVASLEANSKIKLVKQEGLNVGYLAFNQERKPFDNVLVRRAISHAINTQGIVDSIYEGLGKVATNPIPPTMWSYNKNLKGYDYDIKKAKALLKEAGFPNGFETNIWAMPVARPYNPNGRKVAEAMQADLAKVGIKVKIISYDWGTYLKKAAMGEHDMVLLGWSGDNGDPDNFLNVLLSKHGAMHKPAENKAFWKNDEFTALIDKAKQVTDIKERTALYMKAQVIFEEEAVWKPIAHSLVIVPMLNKVHGFKIDPSSKRRFKEVWIEK
ncbi:MAG: ABC transporter substrate-binding protein [Campylobacterales bacterium]|nr:ABC transporter substrate-binding protein [Campylobacterales bacterium]